MSDEKKLAAQEAMKVESQFLKGNIAQELADLSTDDVSNEAYELLKFHGSYFGHNRDTATERKKQKLDKEYEFMVRTRIPGGRLTAEQYIALDDIADKYANGTIRLTSRQTVQFHVILKKDLKSSIADINHCLLSTQSACGDVVRNVTISPAPYKNAKFERLRADCDAVAEFVRPKTSAYREIWLDEEADELREREVPAEHYEPLYGETYLPRKFKIGLIVPEDNNIDVFTHDLGFVLIYEGEELKGYNVLVGGGMGMSHEPNKEWAEKKTYPRLADPIAFIKPDELLKMTEAVVKLQRDHGDRSDRKHARLKYVVQEKGLDWMKSELAKYFKEAGGSEINAPVPVERYDIPSHMGWHEQGDGKLFLGVVVPSGRVVDYDKENQSGYQQNVTEQFAKAQYRTGLRDIIKEYGMNLVITATEELIFCDIDPKDKDAIEAKLASYGIPLAEEYTPMAINLMACVALPTCAKALAESERVQFPLMQDIQQRLDAHGISDEKIAVRIVGCPNGCVRPYVGDIGIVGRMPGHYVLFLGGDFEGTRLSTKVFDKVPQDEIAVALDPFFKRFAEQKQDGEGFGDFCHRVGVGKLAEEVMPELSDYKWAA